MEPTNIIHVMLGQAQAKPAVPVEEVDYGFLASVANAGLAEQLIMLVLGLISIASWAIIVFKIRSLRRAYQESESFLDSFWASKRLDAIFQKSEELTSSPLSQVFRAG